MRLSSASKPANPLVEMERVELPQPRPKRGVLPLYDISLLPTEDSNLDCLIQSQASYPLDERGMAVPGLEPGAYSL